MAAILAITIIFVAVGGWVLADAINQLDNPSNTDKQ